MTTNDPVSHQKLYQAAAEIRGMRDMLANLTAQEVYRHAFISAVRSNRQVPSCGDLLAALVSLKAKLQKLDATLRAEFSRLYAINHARFITGFWSVRAATAAIPAEAKEHLVAVLRLDEAACLERNQRFGGWIITAEQKLQDSLLEVKTEEAKSLWREINQAQRVFIAESDVAIAKIFDGMVNESGLPEMIRSEIQTALSNARPNPHAANGVCADWIKAINDVIVALGMSKEMTHAESELAEALERAEAWMAGKPVEFGQAQGDAFYCLGSGQLAYAAHDKFSTGVLRFLERIGVAPGSAAERVILRNGFMTSDAYWYVYPTTMGHAVLASIPLRRAPRNECVFLVRGGIHAALVWLLEHYNASMSHLERPGGWERRFELIDAPVEQTRNLFQLLGAETCVEKYLQAKALISEILAEDTSPQT